MTEAALDPVARALVLGAQAYIDRALGEMTRRLAVLEAREPVGIREIIRGEGGALLITLSDGRIINHGVIDGRPGQDIDREEAKGWIAEAARDAARKAAITPDPAAIADVLQERMTGVLRDMVALEVATLPTPENGRDADPELIKECVAEAVAAIPVSVDGKDADPKDVADRLREPVVDQLLGEAMSRTERYFSTIQKTVADYADEKIEASIERRWAEMPVPKDGKDADNIMITKDVINAVLPEVLARAQEIVASLPKAVDGLPGRDGEPGEKGEPGERGQDGVSVELSEVTRMIDESVKLAVDTLVLPVAAEIEAIKAEISGVSSRVEIVAEGALKSSEADDEFMSQVNSLLADPTV